MSLIRAFLRPAVTQTHTQDAGIPKELAQHAWGVLNDAYCITDAVIMHSPHVLALACLVFATTALLRAGGGSAGAAVPVPSLRAAAQWDMAKWLQGLNTDLSEVGVVECLVFGVLKR